MERKILMGVRTYLIVVPSLTDGHTNTNTYRLELHNILIQMLYYLKMNQANNGGFYLFYNP